MKIEDMKSLDVGAAGIEVEGEIFRALKPRQTNYGWGQFIVIDDKTGKQGCNVGVASENEGFKQGQYVKVKGKLSDWYKDSRGVDKRTIEGGVFDEVVQTNEDVAPAKQSVEQPEQSPKPEKVDPKIWEAKDLRMARESALKNIARYVVYKLIKLKDRFKYAQEDVDFIYNGLKGNDNITSEDIKEIFGGETVEIPQTEENPLLSKATGKTKEQLIKKARETVKKVEDKDSFLRRNPHLREPINQVMATVAQKKQIYGYIDENEKKIGGMVDSKYITKAEVKGIGEASKLTKVNAIKYWGYWYGEEGELGERDKRELSAEPKESKNLFKKEEPIVKGEQTSLLRDVLIDDIIEQRKVLGLEDDAKFEKIIGYNPKINELSEEELLKLKKLLRNWKPDWVKK